VDGEAGAEDGGCGWGVEGGRDGGGVGGGGEDVVLEGAGDEVAGDFLAGAAFLAVFEAGWARVVYFGEPFDAYSGADGWLGHLWAVRCHGSHTPMTANLSSFPLHQRGLAGRTRMTSLAVWETAGRRSSSGICQHRNGRVLSEFFTR